MVIPMIRLVVVELLAVLSANELVLLAVGIVAGGGGCSGVPAPMIGRASPWQNRSSRRALSCSGRGLLRTHSR